MGERKGGTHGALCHHMVPGIYGTGGDGEPRSRPREKPLRGLVICFWFISTSTLVIEKAWFFPPSPFLVQWKLWDGYQFICIVQLFNTPSPPALLSSPDWPAKLLPPTPYFCLFLPPPLMFMWLSIYSFYLCKPVHGLRFHAAQPAWFKKHYMQYAMAVAA